TVCPGLMRTGSPRNAFFKGQNEAEYAWFSTSAALPFLSMNANRAARRIVDACRAGLSELVLSAPARFAVKAHALLPGLSSSLLTAVDYAMPRSHGDPKEARTG